MDSGSTDARGEAPPGGTFRSGPLWPSRRLVALLCLLAVAWGIGTAAANRRFRQPRVGIVDVGRAFEEFDRTKAEQGVLADRMDALQKRLTDLEGDYERIGVDIKQLKPDSPRVVELQVRRKEIELTVMQLKRTELLKLNEDRMKILSTLRDEISAVIEKYSRAHDLDLVLEVQVKAETDGAGGGFRWPICHYHKAEFDITNDVISLLNAKP